MVIVIERWRLKPGLEASALELMQKMDDLVGPAAHGDWGWCGHAEFYQSDHDPAEVLMVYPWRSRALHAALREREEPVLQCFYEDYCARPRDVAYYERLPVDVEGQTAGSGQGQP